MINSYYAEGLQLGSRYMDNCNNYGRSLCTRPDPTFDCYASTRGWSSSGSRIKSESSCESYYASKIAQILISYPLSRYERTW